jgi:D-tyrosyl-tRNA(Tyr) deacylase
MICLIQRCLSGSVSINNENVASIKQGMVVLVGFEPNDEQSTLEKMSHKLLNYRLFADDQDRMNLNIQQVHGEILLVPQFTLAANTHSGLRPSFSDAAQPAIAKQLFSDFHNLTKTQFLATQKGVFGADMQVALVNDGPVTFWLQTT